MVVENHASGLGMIEEHETKYIWQFPPNLPARRTHLTNMTDDRFDFGVCWLTTQENFDGERLPDFADHGGDPIHHRLHALFGLGGVWRSDFDIRPRVPRVLTDTKIGLAWLATNQNVRPQLHCYGGPVTPKQMNRRQLCKRRDILSEDAAYQFLCASKPFKRGQ